MRAAVCYSLKDVSVEEVPVPALGPGDILVRVEICGLCGSDISKLGPEREGVGRILGHELTGVIVDCGSAAGRLEIGQRVMAAHHAPCFSCHYCRHGSYSMCPSFKASNLDPGGFAELVRVPAANVEHVTYPLPEGMSFEVGSFAEPLACCLRAMRRSPIQHGDVALVLGLGSIGLLFLQLFQVFHMISAGADPVPERQELARQLGADPIGSPDDPEFLAALQDRTQGRGPDLIVTATESPNALRQAMSLVRGGGTVNLFGGIARPMVELNIEELYKREITLMSSYSSSPMDFPFSMELLGSGKVRVAEMITHRYGLDGLGEAITGMIRKTGIKQLILPNR